jgi:hypothetical protein
MDQPTFSTAAAAGPLIRSIENRKMQQFHVSTMVAYSETCGVAACMAPLREPALANYRMQLGHAILSASFIRED